VLENLVPNLKAQIAEVERDGITFPGQVQWSSCLLLFFF
jgi:hypothetical protein